ncbi:hypothetical protein QAD02_009706 [Eretmocerus hayati]|uniref:Uncharacterized protein n=1 Tax=Eretmocerus hayati TaxID=131215 RepID=A0ACC2NBB4_9HYME|nr:hypothetical protein QAD02_009706 [Eretmocerus hayati]
MLYVYVSDDEWTAVNNASNVNEPNTFEDFVDIHVEVAVTGLLTDDEIIKSCSFFNTDDDQGTSDEDESNLENNATGAQARKLPTAPLLYWMQNSMQSRLSQEVFQ